MWPDTWSVTCSLLQRWLSSTKTGAFQRTVLRLKAALLFHLYTFKYFFRENLWNFWRIIECSKSPPPPSYQFFSSKGRTCTVLLILLIVVITTGCILLHNLSFLWHSAVPVHVQIALAVACLQYIHFQFKPPHLSSSSSPQTCGCYFIWQHSVCCLLSACLSY